MDLIVCFLVGIIVITLGLMVVAQYKYIEAMDKRQKELNMTQGEMYEKMSFQENMLHRGIQSNFITGAIAYFLYKLINKNKRTEF
ncbi:DUF3949 domain-containing protein [Clostridium ganghwense]|uniref:DUF3949 domain-containing protein n=1 Tax=Clostridium ganghwense TaxID=312089 RepID=A0ABT4CT28_9CLOT|nr:DUF3949 domain-containing protein [Clostridium ganghwense]MCY6372222.1 DUF3949 domain-containing protein [Clostridium ganghwense]